MWTFILLAFGLVLSLYGLKKSLQEKKHPPKKQTRRTNHTFYLIAMSAMKMK